MRNKLIVIFLIVEMILNVSLIVNATQTTGKTVEEEISRPEYEVNTDVVGKSTGSMAKSNSKYTAFVINDANGNYYICYTEDEINFEKIKINYENIILTDIKVFEDKFYFVITTGEKSEYYEEEVNEDYENFNNYILTTTDFTNLEKLNAINFKSSSVLFDKTGDTYIWANKNFSDEIVEIDEFKDKYTVSETKNKSGEYEYYISKNLISFEKKTLEITIPNNSITISERVGNYNWYTKTVYENYSIYSIATNEDGLYISIELFVYEEGYDDDPSTNSRFGSEYYENQVFATNDFKNYSVTRTKEESNLPNLRLNMGEYRICFERSDCTIQTANIYVEDIKTGNKDEICDYTTGSAYYYIWYFNEDYDKYNFNLFLNEITNQDIVEEYNTESKMIYINPKTKKMICYKTDIDALKITTAAYSYDMDALLYDKNYLIVSEDNYLTSAKIKLPGDYNTIKILKDKLLVIGEKNSLIFDKSDLKSKSLKLNTSTKKITNIDVSNATVENIKNQIVKAINIEKNKITKIVDYLGKEITDLTKKIGTGTKITIEGKGDYTVVLYGDCNGDGKINALDSLAIVKNNLNKIKFKSDIFEEAGRILTKTGTPKAADALAIIRQSLGKYEIEQDR